MRTTKIEWTERTWNPVTGCTKYSEGCRHCYAEMMTRRLKAMGLDKYKNGFCPTIHPETLDEPLKWKTPTTIFVCSMSDLFHQQVPFTFVDKVLDIIRLTPWHNYQILTKRAKRMFEYFQNKNIPKNVWLGVTVENISSIPRIDYLRQLNSSIRFLSCEPLLEDLGILNLTNVDWIIVGGESGNQARPIREEWILNIKEQADINEIPFFFKQWGTWGKDGVKRNKKVNGKILQGKVVQNMPLVCVD